MADKSYRVLLPDDALPKAYDLDLEPDFERFTFDGRVKIHLEVNVATEDVTLHAKELSIESAVFRAAGGSKELEASEIAYRKKDMTVRFSFDEVLPVGEGVLDIKFRGCLNDQMAGFYRSGYTNSRGEKAYMAVTQFEAIDARRCFPCWDEPARKAVFTCSLTVPQNLMALANMPELRSETLKGGKKRVSFMPTPKMSTYILAFCVGELDFVQCQSKAGVLCRIFGCPGKSSQCTLALAAAAKALDYYNDFFGHPYPLPKMDMVAVPDFSAGAMENWGLVTYREVALLCEENKVSSAHKQRIVTVITHELAHQWFGNLVTMQWWDDLWLNEGFANWMQTFCADALFPEWKIWESYVSTDQQRALSLDSLRSSHPIQVPIGKAETVEEVFDAISYSKGGSVIRMIHAVLGKDAFQRGLRAYFTKHQYGNTETSDLWRAWSEASGKDMAHMMGAWTSQMGYPVLKVKNDPLVDGTGELQLEQNWFLANGSVQPGDEKSIWVIPVLVATDKGLNEVQLFDAASGKVPVQASVLQGASWLKVNYGQHCVVRVLYSDSLGARLAANMKELPAEDRIGMISDTLALAKAGHVSPAQTAGLLGGCMSERNDKVWTIISGVLKFFHEQLQCKGITSGTHKAFTSFASALIAPSVASVGWEGRAGDDDNTKALRQTMVGLVAEFSATDPDVYRIANNFVEVILESGPNAAGAPSTDVRGAAFKVAAAGCPAAAQEALFARLTEAHNKSDDSVLRREIYSALAAFPSELLLQRALEWCLTDVKPQDIVFLIMSVASSGSLGGKLTFQWVQERYDALYGLFGATSMMLFQHVIRLSGMGLDSEEECQLFEAYWSRSSVATLVKKSIDQTAESIRLRVKVLERFTGCEVNAASFWEAAQSKLS